VTSPVAEPAANPVARVAVDVPLPHLDRLFDYLVPPPMARDAVPGCRVRVRFAGRRMAGYLVERVSASGHDGDLAALDRVVSPEPVLTPEIAGLARAVADRYGGTLADVLRLAIPPRRAAAEAADTAMAAVAARAADPPVNAGMAEAAAPWAAYPAGAAFLGALAQGRAPRAVWSALPGRHWPAQIAAAVAAAAASGRGALVVVPDARDLSLVHAEIAAAIGADSMVSLSAELGPTERYRRWLAVSRGQVRVVAGTRSAMFAPVTDLGLVVVWDDGDDLHSEPRAPYPHVRDVLLLRAHRCGAAALVGGFAQTAESAHLVATGWARPLAAERRTVRRYAPLISTADEDAELARDPAARAARLPGLALRTARQALEAGPVLFQVPRKGYLAAVACRRCGTRRTCRACGGPVAQAGREEPLACRWCGSEAEGGCAEPECGATGIRALATGARRTAEELGRAFPGVPVRTSTAAHVLAEVPGTPAVVIATPGAEPMTPGGYAAAVLLDGWALLGRASLQASQEALRRWMNAAALVRPGGDGGRVIIHLDAAPAAVQALIRWDPATHASRELAERQQLCLPPAVRMAALTGDGEAIRELLKAAALPSGAEVLGPVAVPAWLEPDRGAAQPAERFLVRVPLAEGTALAIALRGALAEKIARKDARLIRLRLDPAALI
jgi:primosomal protein N' (replication factor Y)